MMSGGDNDGRQQINLHPNPLRKPNGLTLEGLVKTLASIETDIAWIKNELNQRNKRIDELARTLNELSTILSKFAAVQSNIESEIRTINKRLDDHEFRLRQTEKTDYKIVGAVSFASALLSGGLLFLILRIVGGG